jgi:hypothetical protein
MTYISNDFHIILYILIHLFVAIKLLQMKGKADCDKSTMTTMNPTAVRALYNQVAFLLL